MRFGGVSPERVGWNLTIVPYVMRAPCAHHVGGVAVAVTPVANLNVAPREGDPAYAVGLWALPVLGQSLTHKLLSHESLVPLHNE
jgi:hypothetical protein